MMRGYRDSLSHGDGQLRWDHPFVSQDNPRYGAPIGYRPLEERSVLRPFGLTSIPMDPYAATRMMMLSNNTGHGVSPRLPQIQYSQQLIPRYIGQETDGSKLITREEQEIVLKKLKKQIYNPMPKILARRVSLYYRDLNRDPNSKAMEKHRDEEKKSCAICLEDFEPREEVMLTPCTHMFHEECIVPWVKEHGKCPVCRANFFERRENGSASNIDSRQVVHQPAADHRLLFSDELLSVIQAMDEAFSWRF
ncbi:RING-H2 finger protein ATL68 [Beta vulgaris subsp. vulgaris]|uniref:RING-H2 finger protein ATL68 n=1 Tax=Beta vulgaris subsp. vulgaris TaxID=3555 RepID=UPI00203703E6|nr:RING-H2 finger protein ATL68 [Beta vulgaris subsp. vulgaris]